MTRPGQRPLVRLPTLEARRAELETCAFCPKLCRTTCPVSNAEPREALIPWGKMTGAYAMAVGDVEPTVENAAPSWACTGCLACREACDHKNPVATTLLESRAALFARGLAPEGAGRVVRDHAQKREETRQSARRAHRGESAHGPLLLVGCTYLRKLPETATNAITIAQSILGETPRVYEGCCGLPLLMAGDLEGFQEGVAEVAHAAREQGRLVVVDPGCAHALAKLAPALEATSRSSPASANAGHDVPVELLIDLAAKSIERFRRAAGPLTAARYHDPCTLGRGLERYDEPRRLLAHVLGTTAAEFVHSREHGMCGGAGGLLPVTMPETSATITRMRTSPGEAGHDDLPIVTACASSLLAFRRAGKVAYDLCDILAPALVQESSPR